MAGGRGRQPLLAEGEFIKLFRELGASEMARRGFGTERSIYARRRTIEGKSDLHLAPPSQLSQQHPGRINLELKNGTILVGSDFHIWPGDPSTCLRAFKKFVDDVKPDAIVLNGDVMDFPRISRFPQSWEKAPDVHEELEAAHDHLADIVQRGKRGSRKVWTLGNHDARFESLIANAAPQLKNVKGVHLSDHFTIWQKAMSLFVNDGLEGGATMIKHRLKGGIHATRNNTLNAGVSTVTGHLHSQNVRPLSDYRAFERYGVDTGCVADPHHRAFAYTEDGPVDWRSGFALLTYREGRLLFPELITKWDPSSVQFRGKIIRV